MIRFGRLSLVLAVLLLLPTAVSAQKDSKYTREASKYMGLAMTRSDEAQRTQMYQQALTHLREGMQQDAGNAKVWLLAGTVLVFGECGIRAGAGMRRGTIGLLGARPEALLPSFRYAATLPLANQISPTCPAGQRFCVVGSTISSRISSGGLPQPTRTRLFSAVASTGSTRS